MSNHLTASRFALMLSVALVAMSVALAPASARADKQGSSAAAPAKAKAVPRPKAKAKVKVAKPVAQKVPRALGPKEITPKPEPAKDDDLERKNAGKVDGHKWRPRSRA